MGRLSGWITQQNSIGKRIWQHHILLQVSESPEARNSAVLIGKLPEDTQVTTKDTGWSEEEKERMRQNGYDDMDMVRAWYS